MNERKYILRDERIKGNCVDFVSRLPLADKPMEVIIRPHKRVRRTEANSYYWSMLTHIATEATRQGIVDEYKAPEVWHEYFKQKFLGMRVVIDGDVSLIPSTTTDKSVMEFMDYTMQVEAWAAEHGIVVPQQGVV